MMISVIVFINKLTRIERNFPKYYPDVYKDKSESLFKFKDDKVSFNRDKSEKL